MLLKLCFGLVLIVTGLFAQASSAGMLKALPSASDTTKVLLLRYLAEKGSGEAYSAFTYYLGYGRSTSLVNPKPTSPDMFAELREVAAVGLGNCKDKKAVPLLIHSLKDDDNQMVLCAVAHALGQLGDIEALPYLIKQLQATTDKKLAYEITWAISQFKDESIMLPMLEIMRGPYVPSAKVVAKQALKDLGWPESIGY
jgi:HEAT repeat protein